MSQPWQQFGPQGAPGGFVPPGVPGVMPAGFHPAASMPVAMPNYARPGGPAINDQLAAMIAAANQGDVASVGAASAELGPDGKPKEPFSLYGDVLPKPIHMLYGAGAGIAMGEALRYLGDPSRLRKAAEWLEIGKNGQPTVIGNASQWLEGHLTKLAANNPTGFWARFLGKAPPAALEQQLVTETLENLGRHSRVLPGIFSQIGSHSSLAGAQNAVTALVDEKKIIEAYVNGLGNKLDKVLLADGKTLVKDALLNAKSLTEARSLVKPGWFSNPIAGATDKTLAKELAKGLKEARFGFLALDGAATRLRKLGEAQEIYKLTHTATSGKNIGPIGRFVMNKGETLKRIFTGETVGAGKASGASFFQRMFGPAFIGLIAVGMAFTQASKAEEGDKTRTFMHNFLGIGVGSFVGWELGRNFLNRTGLVQKAFDLVGWSASKSRKLLPYVGRFTRIGVITELLAIFGFGYLGQKIGEKVSNLIFGKPKSVQKEEIEAAGGKIAERFDNGRPLVRPGTYNRFAQSAALPASAELGDTRGEKKGDKVEHSIQFSDPALAGLDPGLISENPAALDSLREMEVMWKEARTPKSRRHQNIFDV